MKASKENEKNTNNKGRPKILIVEKSGEIKEVHYLGDVCVSKEEINLAEISKRAGHKNPDGFDHVETWNIPLNDQEYSIRLYGKIRGRANYENKYEFPPPVDTLLLFGSCALIRYDAQTNQIIGLSAKEWSNIYEYLYGGFDDLDDTDDNTEEEEDEEYEIKTKTGYKKDGFVVDDDDEKNSDGDGDGEEEEEYEDEGGGNTKDKDESKRTRKVETAKKSIIDYYNCDNELCEESYIE